MQNKQMNETTDEKEEGKRDIEQMEKELDEGKIYANVFTCNKPLSTEMKEKKIKKEDVKLSIQHSSTVQLMWTKACFKYLSSLVPVEMAKSRIQIC